MPDTDLVLWEQELGPLSQYSELLARADTPPWGWFETLSVLAVLIAGPVGFLIGLML